MTNEESPIGPATPELSEILESEPRAESKLLEIPQIGIWGTRASGKTTLLAMLRLHATKERAGFEFLAAPGRSEIQRETGRFCQEAEKMVTTGQFMKATSTPREIVFQVRLPLRSRRGGHQVSLLRMTDWPGDWYANEFRKRIEQDENYEWPEVMRDALRSLAKCQGLLCLLDMEHLGRASVDPKGSHFLEFSWLFQALVDEAPKDRAGYLEQYFALCMSKADLYWDYYSLNNYSAEQVYNDLVDGPTRNEIAKYVHPDRMKICMCSAVGTIIDEHGRPRPNVKKSGKKQSGETEYAIVRPQNIEPYGIFEPLKWLFDRLHTS